MKNKNKVYVEQTFECSINTLFEWLTKPEMVAQWFGPEGFSAGLVKSDLRIGGKYSIELKKDDNLVFTVQGEYLAIQTPDLLKFTYNYLGLTNPPPASIIVFTLTRVESDQTSLSIVQTFEMETPDFIARTKAWNFMFERLALLIYH